MVYRVYVEKKQGLEAEAKSLRYDIRHLLGIKSLDDVRIVNRYDVENIEKDLFQYAVKTVFSEPQLDNVSSELNFGDATIFAVEFLPGQFDQRADSAAQCIQIISQKERPLVKTAKVYALYGSLSLEEIDRIKKHLINPVESQEASLEKYETLKMNYSIPETVETLAYCSFKNCSSLSDINYSGSKSQWETITFKENWNEDCPSITVHCTDGDISI